MSYGRFRSDPIAQHFVRLVDIIFGVILAQGFVIYRNSIVAPSLSVSNLSLLLVYATVLLSWIGYHRSVNAFPYNATSVSKIRLLFDILILVLYSYLVLAAENISMVLLGLFLVSLLYMVTGLIRILEWKDRKVSRLRLSGLLTVGYLAEWLFSPAGLFSSWSVPLIGEETLSWFLVVLALVLLIAYRWIRGRRGYPPIVPVGIDVDGVLGEQVPPVLARIQQRKNKGIGLTKEDITRWDCPIDDSRIDREIEEALLDPEYVREMAVVSGSTTVMSELQKRFHIVIASSRPVEAETETIAWLKRNFPGSWHEYVNTRQVGKQKLGIKILVDDYPENAKRFASESGTVLLFSQPWNREEDEDMKRLMHAGRVIRCNDWKDVEEQLCKLGHLRWPIP